MSRFNRIGTGITYTSIGLLLAIPTKFEHLGDSLFAMTSTWSGSLFVAAVVAASVILFVQGALAILNEHIRL